MSLYLSIGWILWLVCSALAGEICPEKIQSVLLAKVISYTREISSAPKGEVNIGVLCGGPMVDFIKSSAASATDTIKVKSVGLDNLAGINILYVPKGMAPDQVT